MSSQLGNNAAGGGLVLLPEEPRGSREEDNFPLSKKVSR